MLDSSWERDLDEWLEPTRKRDRVTFEFGGSDREREIEFSNLQCAHDSVLRVHHDSVLRVHAFTAEQRMIFIEKRAESALCMGGYRCLYDTNAWVLFMDEELQKCFDELKSPDQHPKGHFPPGLRASYWFRAAEIVGRISGTEGVSFDLPSDGVKGIRDTGDMAAYFASFFQKLYFVLCKASPAELERSDYRAVASAGKRLFSGGDAISRLVTKNPDAPVDDDSIINYGHEFLGAFTEGAIPHLCRLTG